ncbi:Arabinogalactan peptide 16 [Apostasia shenzhenica]|uniref:Arabinogalactan peptide 16 n=1 Tax=Apostasia shenzhenica TaxID=1088818 RepID=A0A2I0A5W9_9ASPA|nr:Arabinogalactan peptide 16 [Apostasia shenzhenica]
MEVGARISAFFTIAFFFSGLMQIAYGADTCKPSQLADGKTIDLGIAYVLMLAALLITYIIH